MNVHWIVSAFIPLTHLFILLQEYSDYFRKILVQKRYGLKLKVSRAASNYFCFRVKVELIEGQSRHIICEIDSVGISLSLFHFKYFMLIFRYIQLTACHSQWVPPIYRSLTTIKPLDVDTPLPFHYIVIWIFRSIYEICFPIISSCIADISYVPFYTNRHNLFLFLVPSLFSRATSNFHLESSLLSPLFQLNSPLSSKFFIIRNIGTDFESVSFKFKGLKRENDRKLCGCLFFSKEVRTLFSPIDSTFIVLFPLIVVFFINPWN